jgi:predicted enzyme related to lactoylglutathione lyase
MPHVDAHTPGSFSWFELSTTDQVAAKAFYQRLFGWTIQDHSMGPAGVYTIFHKDGRDVAAAAGLREDQQKMGVPSHWLTYVTVENVDETAKEATALGGTLIAEPFDVMQNGRMAVVQDPQGATFALWQPNQHPGVKVIAEPGAFAWAELLTTDAPAATTFYTKLFGWQTMTMPFGGQDYTVVQVGERPVGGIYPLPPGAPAPPSWTIYFEVADCDAAIADATAQGATLIMGPIDAEGIGRFAGLQDPQGAFFSVIKSATA